MKLHPGSTVSIYDIPGIVKLSLPNAATPKNIQAGFKKTGIWEFNKNVFSEEDFLCSSVTDRSLENLEPIQEDLNPSPERIEKENLNEPPPNAEITKEETLSQLGPSTRIDMVENREIVCDTESERFFQSGKSVIESNNAENKCTVVTPTAIRPFPKARPRKNKRTARKTLKSSILTSTPVKEGIRNEQIKIAEKKKEKKTESK